MGMFDNYPSPPDYIPNNMIKVLPTPEAPPDTLPRPEYNIVGKLIGYSWRYRDTVEITYKVDEYIKESANTMLAEVSILSHNREKLHTFDLIGDEEISFVIDKELSEKLIRGNYYITFKLYDDTQVYISTEMFVIIK